MWLLVIVAFFNVFGKQTCFFLHLQRIMRSPKLKLVLLSPHWCLGLLKLKSSDLTGIKVSAAPGPHQCIAPHFEATLTELVFNFQLELTCGVSWHLNDAFALLPDLPVVEGSNPHRYLHRGPGHDAGGCVVDWKSRTPAQVEGNVITPVYATSLTC